MKKIVGLLFLFFVGSVSATLTPVTVALDWYINPDHAILLVAQAKGYFQQNGLKVQFVSPTESSVPEKLVALNQADVAVSYQSQLLLDVSAGMPLVRFATLINHPLDCITVLSNGPIHQISDLKGKTIGVATGTLTNALMQAVLAHNGVSLDQVHLVSVGMDLTSALEDHNVDATMGMMRNVEPVEMKQDGFETRLFFPENNGVPNYDELILLVNQSNLHQPWLKPFVRALQEAADEIQKHPQASWSLIAKTYSNILATTPEMKKTNHAIWNATLPYLAPHPGVLNVQQYQKFEQFMVDQHLLKKSIPLDTYAVDVKA